jgi:Xaa-Pro aminopeptidase
MAKNGLDAYLIPVHDEWMSEYPPACNRRVEWLTGFTGSAGMVAVTTDKAALFVDGRYTLQAAKQVSSDYDVFNSADITPQSWLTKLKAKKIGYDPKLYTKSMLDKYKPIQLIPTENLIDKLWENRPALPVTKIFKHDETYSGESSGSKQARVAEEISKAGADAVFLSAPESVNWLLNIRARDVENTPLCLANAIIDAKGAVYVFVEPSRLDFHLPADVKICLPETLESELKHFAGKKMLIDTASASVFITDLCQKSGITLQEGKDPCTLLKACKNPTEIAGIKIAHIRDGAAVTKLLYWLSNQQKVSELEVVDKLLEFRKQNELFLEPSFDTIAGSGEHGAIVHYRATKESNRYLEQGELFLLDSGGQYFDGTTDITRTIAIGIPTPEHKKRFTQVLKGHIALATAIFPEGTTGAQLDALARQFLWQDGLDYDHGTGHGVGCFLGVHEGPQSISKRAGGTPLQVGMVISNEPGYYKTGEYGIRIENLVAVVEIPTSSLRGKAEAIQNLQHEEKTGLLRSNAPRNDERKFLGFETLTCAPIDTSLIETSMLTDGEKNWLNHYNEWVRADLAPSLSEDELKWLEKSLIAI